MRVHTILGRSAARQSWGGCAIPPRPPVENGPRFKRMTGGLGGQALLPQSFYGLLLLALLLLAALPAYAQAEDHDVAYGTDPAQLLDIYHPTASAPAHLVVFLHGGGWVGGRKAAGKRIAPPLVARGYAVASVGYRLFPQTTAAGEVQDAAQAIAYLLHNARRFNLDPSGFALIGHSSGAHMVALLGTDAGYLRGAGVDPARLRTVITLDGVFDVAANLTHYPQPRKDEVFGHDPAAWARVSPVALIGSMTLHPRFCLVHEDKVPRFIEQENLFEAALKKHGETVQALVAPGLSHVQLVSEFADASQPMANFALACLAAR